MFAFFSLFLAFALASRAFAFNVTAHGRNYTLSQIITVPDSANIKIQCNANCTAAQQQIRSCNDDVSCLCKSETVSQLLTCEQCMFTRLVEANQQLDVRVGSQQVLSGYAASCKTANLTLSANQTALKLPPSWDGPFVAILPVGGAIVTVISAGFLGISALLLLSNM